MKKFLLAIALLFSVSFGASAQSEKIDFTPLEKLVVDLSKTLDKTPKATGDATIDAFIVANQAAAQGAVETAAKLQGLYKRQIGETVDGVQDVTVVKPTMNDWLQLAEALVKQTAGVAGIAATSADIVNAVKANPMKALKLAKPVKWATDIMPVTGKALAEQTKAVDQIVKTLKSGKNL